MKNNRKLQRIYVSLFSKVPKRKIPPSVIPSPPTLFPLSSNETVPTLFHTYHVSPSISTKSWTCTCGFASNGLPLLPLINVVDFPTLLFHSFSFICINTYPSKIHLVLKVKFTLFRGSLEFSQVRRLSHCTNTSNARLRGSLSFEFERILA